MLAVVVDLNRCQAYAQCCFLAPDVFRLCGREVLLHVPLADEAQRLAVTRAAAACPVAAITFGDAADELPAAASSR